MASFYMQRGMHGPPPGIHPITSPTLPRQPNVGGTSGGTTFLEPSSAATVPPHSVNVSGGMQSVSPSGEPVKRKRGRPRKYGPDGTVSLALSPLSSSSTPGSVGTGLGSAPSVPGSRSATSMQKRGRGRPPGSGRKQQLASLGEWVSGSAGLGFTPHIVTISVGEDIATKILSFSQQGPRAVCILSANGAVSTVTLRQPASSGGTVTYEGRFEILCLSGSYLLSDDGGSHGRTGGLSVSLSSPDGRVIGGGVGGMLIAATPVQVIVGSFIYSGAKAKSKSDTGHEAAAESEDATGDISATPAGMPSSQNLTPSVMGGWSSSRPMDMRNAHIDIDLTRG